MRGAVSTVRRPEGECLRAALITRPWRGAVYGGVHADVIERAGQDGYRDRACLAAVAEISVVVAALPGSDTADDQPGSEKQGSDVHMNLRRIHLLWEPNPGATAKKPS